MIRPEVATADIEEIVLETQCKDCGQRFSYRVCKAVAGQLVPAYCRDCKWCQPSIERAYKSLVYAALRVFVPPELPQVPTQKTLEKDAGALQKYHKARLRHIQKLRDLNRTIKKAENNYPDSQIASFAEGFLGWSPEQVLKNAKRKLAEAVDKALLDNAPMTESAGE